MKVTYLSHKLSVSTPSYGGSDSIEIDIKSSIDNGDSSNSQTWHIPNHIGSHVDAPRHFVNNGKTMDQFPAEHWIFSNVRVVECHVGAGDLVTVEFLEGKVDTQCDCLLIKTGFEKHRGEQVYWSENPGIAPEVGAWLKKQRPNVRAVGIDTISVSSWKNRETGRKAHRAFLSSDGDENAIILIEDMSLCEVNENMTIDELIVVPIIMDGADGAPCTIIAKIMEND